MGVAPPGLEFHTLNFPSAYALGYMISRLRRSVLVASLQTALASFIEVTVSGSSHYGLGARAGLALNEATEGRDVRFVATGCENHQTQLGAVSRANDSLRCKDLIVFIAPVGYHPGPCRVTI